MSNTTRQTHARQGFSLVELLVVMAIIAILVSIVIGIVGGVQRGAAESKAKAEIASLMTEIENYREDVGAYPVDLATFLTWYKSHYANTIYKLTDIGTKTVSSVKVEFPADPWGNEYYYSYTPASSPNVYVIGSTGPDGRFGTAGPGSWRAERFGKGDDITNRNGSL